jgi:hypothetical protein
MKIADIQGAIQAGKIRITDHADEEAQKLCLNQEALP